MQFPGATHHTKVPDDELLDLLDFGIPSSLQEAMTLQDFNPVEHTISKFVSFCEHMETT